MGFLYLFYSWHAPKNQRREWPLTVSSNEDESTMKKWRGRPIHGDPDARKTNPKGNSEMNEDTRVHE
jgi:hypothetical protein